MADKTPAEKLTGVLTQHLARMPGDEAEAKIDALDAALRAAETERLRAFIVELFAVSEWPDGGDIDLGDFQELAIKHGLLKPERRTEPCHDGCFDEFKTEGWRQRHWEKKHGKAA